MEKVTGLELGFLLRVLKLVYGVVAKAIDVCAEDSDWKGRKGGAFCLADGATGFPYATVLVGEVPKNKADKYKALCQEKAFRLASHPDHVGSWESRDPSNGKWGGAIRFGKDIYSFSGFPEMGDEATMLSVIMQIGNPLAEPPGWLDKTAARNENPYWKRFIFGTAVLV